MATPEVKVKKRRKHEVVRPDKSQPLETCNSLCEQHGLVEKEGLLFFSFKDEEWETALDNDREDRFASL